MKYAAKDGAIINAQTNEQLSTDEIVELLNAGEGMKEKISNALDYLYEDSDDSCYDATCALEGN